MSSIGATPVDTLCLSLPVSSNLKALIEQLTDYIRVKDMGGVSWVVNRFSEQAVTKAELIVRLHDQLIEISSDQSAK